MKHSRTRRGPAAAGILLGLAAGCAAPPGGPAGADAGNAAGGRPDSTAAVDALVRDAVRLMDDDPVAATGRIDEALTADPFHGPALHNRGVLAWRRGDLREAAIAFEAAGRAMPGNPEPRLALGLVLERAGRIDEAIDRYRAALERSPQHLPTMQALARVRLRWNRFEDDGPPLLDMIDAIALRADDAAWRAWAVRMRPRAEAQATRSAGRP